MEANTIPVGKHLQKVITDKWKNILIEYEKVKQKKSTLFDSVNHLCEVHRISRKQLRQYHGRWIKAGKQDIALLPKKRGPRRGQCRMLSKEQERALVKIQRKFEAKPLDVWLLVKGSWEVHPSVKTIARTLKRYPTKKKKEIIHRYEKQIPGELIHGDTFNLPKEIFKDRKQRYMLGLVDDCTRLAYAEVVPEKTGLEVGDAFMRGGKWYDIHGIEVEALMTDNGTEFTTSGRYKEKIRLKHAFEIMLRFARVEHRYTKPYTPKTNGKVERFWRILKEEFLAGQKDLSEEGFKDNLKDFMYFYNYRRPHGGIEYKTPLKKLEFVTETLV